MKRFIFYIFLIVSLAPPNLVFANFSTKNIEGVTLTFFDDDNSIGATQTLSQNVLIQAMSLEGSRYKLGGNSPETGFDCSGFVNYVFNQAANVELPRTTGGLSRVGQSVAPNELQPGDLVFFNTRSSAYSHVGIYIGDGDFIHAPRAGKTVTIENMASGYWQQHFNGAKRIDEIQQSKDIHYESDRLSLWPKSRSGSTLSRISCFSSFDSGKRPATFLSNNTISFNLTIKLPPVPGTKATACKSASNVVNSSCAIQAALNNHRHWVQYSIST